jgi:radical SAM/Cys-rich protein
MGPVQIISPFEEKVPQGLKARGIDVLQVNVGYRCNLTCHHCHVQAGPDRREAMSRGIMERCLEVLRTYSIPTIDITGGSPEMHRDIPWFMEECAASKCRVLVRTNGVILLEQEYRFLIDLYTRNRVEVVISLPHMDPKTTERQRGEGVFDKLIEVIRRLNDRGYGQEGSGLVLDLVHNPVGAYLPGSQLGIELDYRRTLEEKYSVCFTRLFSITNMPIGRYLEYLRRTDNFEDYMKALAKAFNPATLTGVMCKSTISVGRNGTLFDCDFNQVLGLAVNHGAPDHISRFDWDKLACRKIVVGNHCYGCTAGSGSSCQGETWETLP